ncbi:MAG TPA: glycosyltransferase family 1 protein [Verrucomicrobiae bacterium]|nr:glycosyltransferase family 1 protein [Verrucomicrobiae bacterium]
MRIIVTGLVGQYAFGGVAWDYLQFVEGFRQLGHDVFYLEDTEMWPYDPIQNTISNDCRYNVKYLGDVMEKFGLGDRWIYRNAPDGSYHGRPETETKAICATADVFLNVSGCGWLRPEYLRIPKKIFLDSDPLFTQVALVSGKQDVIDRIRAHDFHFTFAENIHARDCRIPAAGFRWIPTRQPIVLEWWQSARRQAAPTLGEPAAGGRVEGSVPEMSEMLRQAQHDSKEIRDVFTTVMNWVSYKSCEYDGETWGQKDVEFMKFIDLPQQTAQNFEIAMGMGPGMTRPTELLQRKGWQIIEPGDHLPDPWKYRDYLRGSKGEWSVAKEGYVKSRSGWFSCRSACYLALGRPCVLQDTGWSAHYPTGHGLCAFGTMEEAVAGIDAINADYAVHARAARQVAERMFDARRVLGQMLERVGS